MFLCFYVPLTGFVWAGCGSAALLAGVLGICRSHSRLRARAKVIVVLAMALAAAMALAGVGILWQYGGELPSLLWQFLAAHVFSG